MQKNVGNIDRVIRVILAAGILALYLTGTIQGTLGLVLLVLAVVFAVTAFISVCPIYMALKIRTLKGKKA